MACNVTLTLMLIASIVVAFFQWCRGNQWEANHKHLSRYCETQKEKIKRLQGFK